MTLNHRGIRSQISSQMQTRHFANDSVFAKKHVSKFEDCAVHWIEITAIPERKILIILLFCYTIDILKHIFKLKSCIIKYLVCG